MTNTNSNQAYKDLTPAQKAARLQAYKANDAKYGIKEGLFRVTHVARHADKNFDGRIMASFGYNVVPVKGVDTADFAPKKFVWVNQLINTKEGASVVAAMEQLANDVNPDKQSALVSIKYKHSKNGKFINVTSLFRRDQKSASNSAKPAQPETNPNAKPDAEDLPF